MTDTKSVTLTFVEEISDNRYRTEHLTPGMLKEIADHVYANPRLTERITELVDVALTEMFPELERETNEDGQMEFEVVLAIYQKHGDRSYSETVTVWSSDPASAEDAALYDWKQNVGWNDEEGEIQVSSVEWAK